jgi:hypothetical protein
MDQVLEHGQWLRSDYHLSYGNTPAITTMLLVAGFPSLDKHFMSWSTLEPPKFCVDMMFVTPDGQNIDDQIERLTQVSRAAVIAGDRRCMFYVHVGMHTGWLAVVCAPAASSPAADLLIDT